ncbi:hypothetical protein VIOR3934_14772 [Vibrio orientalis CIP 102891 = ATCC 33934]|uniref:DUF2860 domain-containing protein n=1 Tax=Vibrio orientalis CIP 102891 = ATCC 33934 TaxID=675816 RepID=C9QDN0_VIBOR|nr:DUF2860 family protein [Vibrio orientalis]EEX93932.1 hypothetical protein VIA_001090 [Vibrio orientalis CIP 102891 = ATCC 33934]EGU48383.1 hypothetical protein VIOR3934_14772 [Vibrio orientalis CIP 102891 = ATCC 33934]
MKLLPVLFTTSSLVFSVSALADLAPEEGLGGYVGLFLGYSSNQSNIDPNNTTHDGSNIDKSSGAAPLPVGELTYTFGDDYDHQLFLGMAEDDLIEGMGVLQIGYQSELSDGSVIGISYMPTIGGTDLYSDPYASRLQRTKTKVKTHGVRLMGENLAGTPLSLEAAFANTTIDKEQSGQNLTAEQQQLLVRDARTYALKGSYLIEATQGVYLEPRLTYIRYDAKGSATAFHSIQPGVTITTFIERHQLSLSMDYAKRSYDEMNPIYAKKRSDDDFNSTLVYQYVDMFDWDDWTFVGSAGYGKQESNIDFFKGNETMIAAGVMYQF